MLEGKTVVVTGVGPGLGGAVARCVLRDGGNVVMGARNGARLTELAAELDPGGGRVAARATDIADAAQCAALAALAVERFGSVDGVVQVAADEIQGGLARSSDDDWAAVLAANVTGTMHVVSATVDALGAGGGSIVIIGSQTFRVAALRAQQTAYAASKGALHAAMFHLAKALGPRRIRVNTIVPSWMWGPAVQQYVTFQAERRGVEEAAVVAEIAAPMPLGEIPTVQDVAESAVFLCSDRSRMITGQTWYVNAGNHMT
jgi:NAD(P)-dependent dehydrogenase (short-subunit alcohol dehydrogenase family)